MRDFTRERRELVRQLANGGLIRNEHVRQAMLSVPRHFFVWPDTLSSAYEDTPLPLGRTGQTISAPHMVALMLEELQLLPGQRVLEVGCGSGYNAACIATMLGQTGRLISLEVNQELVEFARGNVTKLGLEKRIEIHQADGSLGWPPREKREQYDRIAVTAATPEIPKSLVEQLTRKGILLVPLGGAPVQVLTRVKKDSDAKIQTESVCDCVFVPLLSNGS